MNNNSNKLCGLGYIAFFLSGICAISTGVVVSLLREQYGFDYSVTGTLLSLMNIGNMVASFLSGALPAKIGHRATVLILTSGYVIGYGIMTANGLVLMLSVAFLLVGLAKGCALNNCTVLVGSNVADKTKGMNIMHAAYACGALLGPVIISATLLAGAKGPTIALGVIGLVMWMTFVLVGFPGRVKKEAKKDKTESDWSFLKNKKFWLITGLIFCQNAAETSVTGWLVTYYKGSGILSGTLSNYTITIMWGATLIARLLIAFVFPIKNRFKALAFMGLGCSVLYAVLIVSETQLMAIVVLFMFAFAMAGVNPTGIAGAGNMLSNKSMGVMLPVAGCGAIIMPWVIGMIAENVSLKAGMMSNVVPCVGIMIFSLLLIDRQKSA